MKHKKTSSLILISLLAITLIAFFPPANASSGPIIWSGDTLLTIDPVFVYWDPDIPPKGANVTEYIIYYDRSPSITATRDNQYIWVAWQWNDPGSPTYNDEIFYKTYSTYNGTWSEDTRLTFNPNLDISPAILQATDNKIWIFWVSNRTGNDEIYYTTTSDNGYSWSAMTRVTVDPRSDMSPAVAQTSDGKIWLLWSRQTTTSNEDIFYKTYNGTSWSGETQLTTNANPNQLPSVVQAKDGKIWVFWSQYMPDTYRQIWYKTFDGSTWSSETQLTTEQGQNMYTAVVVERDGTIRVFYQHKGKQTNANWDIFYKISLDNGTTWSLPVQFTSDNANDIQPSATQAPDSSFWVVWTSNRLDPNSNDNIDLYLKVSVLGDVSGPSGVPDGVIDIYDLDAIKRAMPTTPDSPHGKGWLEWNPDCDLNADNKINIIDLVIAELNFGRHA